MRGKPKCKGLLVQRNLLTAVDSLIVEEYAKGEATLWRLNCLVYAGAELVCRRVRGTFRTTRKRPDLKRKEEDVTNLRRAIGWLVAEIQRRKFDKPATSRQMANIRRLRVEHYTIHELVTMLETKKARLRVRVTQLRKLRANAKSRAINTAYRRQGPSCLRSGSGGEQGVQPPSASRVSDYWNSVIGVQGDWEPNEAVVSWMFESAAPCPQGVEPVAPQLWGSVVNRLRSWKAPGRDGICGYWWKSFQQASELLRQALWKILEGGSQTGSDDIPTWFVKGRTVLIPKEGCQGRPEQYRPITCLNTAYKLLTAVMTEVLYKHSTEWGYLPPEQRAIRRGRRGCLDALMIDSMVTREAVARHRDLSVAWIDYQKAYDRVPHEWLSWMLSAMKAPFSVQYTLDHLRKKWSSVFCVGFGSGAVATELEYRRGLFQGDSLSPLLFCLSIAPLSKALRESMRGFKVPYMGTPVSHLFFMDDLKVYAANASALGAALETVDEVSQAVGMKLGLRKCAVAHIKGGKLVNGEDFLLDEERKIEQVARGGTYKYLGIEQLFKPDHKAVRERLTKTYAKRLHRIWSSGLNSKHKVNATNTWAVSVFRYFFTQVKWSEKALKELDILTRRIMRRYKCHHRSASVERLYIRRISGGRGLSNIWQIYEKEVVASELYLVNTAAQDELLQAVVKHHLWMTDKGNHNNLQSARKVLGRYDLWPNLVEEVREGRAGPNDRIVMQDLKAAQAATLVSTLSAKPIHGVYYSQASSPDGVDQEGTFAWLSDGRLRAETEGLIFAAQDGVLLTNRYKRTVLKQSATQSTCRLCREGEETIGHILSSCRSHLWSLIKQRHDRVVYRLMLALCKKLNIKVPDALMWSIDGWKGVAALEGCEAKLLVDLTVPTDRQIEERRPDLVLYLKGQQRIVVMEGAVAWEPLLAERESQKFDKYQDLAADLATQHPGWKVEVVPMVAGCLGTLRNLRASIYGLGIFTRKEATNLCKEIQFEVLCSATRLIRRHLASV